MELHLTQKQLRYESNLVASVLMENQLLTGRIVKLLEEMRRRRNSSGQMFMSEEEVLGWK